MGNETGNDHVTRADAYRCHMCPCENGETQQVTYPVLGWSFTYEDRRRNSGVDHFALILPHNPQYQLGRSVSFRTTNQPVFFCEKPRIT